MSDYWHRTLATRLSRRRALAVTVAASAGSALLAACGGDDDNGSDGQSSSGLVTELKDETAEAKRGGLLRTAAVFDVVRNWDPYSFPNLFTIQPHIYSAPFLIREGVLKNPTGKIEGDVFESFELSPDKLTLTAKVNPNAHFAPVAPVNGRSVDAHDVAFSYQRFRSVSTTRADYLNEINPAAPIASIDAIDSKTVVIKLAAPDATVTSLLAQVAAGSFVIIPKEAQSESALDITRTPVGTGPWYVSDYQPSQSYKYKRNPGFKQEAGDLPYMDEMEWPILTEYTTRLAQFKTGNLHATGVLAPDIVATKRDVSDLVLYKSGYTAPNYRTGFGIGGNSPFKDERVRQAWVLHYDRDLFLEAVADVSKFAAEGIPIDTHWETALPGTAWDGWFLDARSKDFGPNAKYLSKNIDEAKRLLGAAGFSSGVETVFQAYQVSGVAPNPQPTQDILVAMAQETGLFKFQLTQLNFATEFQPKIMSGKGQFEGATVIPAGITGDPAVLGFTFYNSRGTRTLGSDSTTDELTSKAKREFDTEKRKQLVHELQRYEAKANFMPLFGGYWGLGLIWPAVRNYGVHLPLLVAPGSRAYTRVFLDPSKAPLNKA